MNILSIGGSDPSSGAGIQSDIKTFELLGAFGFSAITAITSQNTSEFSKVEPVSPKMIKNQLESIFSDFRIDAIKIGMVYNSQIIKAIFSVLKTKNIPIILDPVIKSTTGGILLKKSAMEDYKKYLIPISYVITPNVFEAEKLSGQKIRNERNLHKCALKLQSIGARNIIITGFERKKTILVDYLLENSKEYKIIGKKLPINNHGSGCNYSAAISVALVMGKNIHSSTKFAKKFVYQSIRNAKKIGKGISITYTKPKLPEITLGNAISNFSQLKNIHLAIPECQTNFVFSKKKPLSINDILGVKGRIVKSGKEVLVAGNLEYGGSRHVASAVLTMNKKFPDVRSGINLKFSKEILKKLSKKGFEILEYDRKKEPLKIKNKENSTISWGIKQAIKNSKSPPDVVFHKGDVGKEAMILIFGKDPQDVFEKISSLSFS